MKNSKPAFSLTPATDSIPERLNFEKFLSSSPGDRFDVRPAHKSGEKEGVEWTCGAQPPCETLAQALDHAGFQAKSFNLVVLEITDNNFDWKLLAGQVFAVKCDIVAVRVSCGNASADALEKLEFGLFEAGFRKHPDYLRITGYEDLNQGPQVGFGIYKHCAEDAITRFPMSFLLERRELHMDMSREHGVRSEAHIIRYLFGADKIPRGAKRILDACCGYGYGSDILAHSHPSAEVVGVDIDKEAIEYAKEIHRSNNIQFVEKDLLDFLKQQKSNSFDAICMFEGMEHVFNVGEILNEMNRLLTLEGVFVVSVPFSWVNEEGIDENPNHVEVYNWQSFRSTLSEGLNLLECYGQTGSRFNKSGKWVPADRDFIKFSIAAEECADSEWLIATAGKRSNCEIHHAKLLSSSNIEINKFKKIVGESNVKAVSFDVFDTLLVRPTFLPEDVFYLLELQLIQEFGPQFEEFCKIRQQSEKAVRQRMNALGIEDILLSEIYAQLALYLNLDEQTTEKALNLELEKELSLLKPRESAKEIFETAKNEGKRIIVASDIYLNEAQLAYLLDNNGFSGFDDLYVSGALRMQKRRGSLFQRIARDMAVHGIDPGEILHLGDNHFADVERARENGFNSFHFMKNTECYAGKTHCWPIGPKLQQASEADFGIRTMQAATIGRIFDDPFRRFARGTTFNNDPFFYGALRLAPLLFFSMKSFAETCAQNGINKVYFVTRDGHLPSEVFRQIAKTLCLDFHVEELHSSRKVLQSLEFKDLNSGIRAAAGWLSNNRRFTFADVLALATGMKPSELLGMVDAQDAVGFDTVVTWDNFDDFKRRLSRVWPKIEAAHDAHYTSIARYFDLKFGGNRAHETAIWDVGYFHTTAHALSKMGYAVGLSGHLIEIAHHKQRKVFTNSDFKKHSYLGAINNSLDDWYFSTKRHSVYLELLLSDPSSASRRYFTKDGKPIVLSEQDELLTLNVNPISEIHSGVVTAVDNLVSWLGDDVRYLNASPSQVLNLAFNSKVMTELSSANELFFENGEIFQLTSVT